MKVEPRQAAAFLRAPGKTRCVLLHGEDEGQIRENAQILTRLIAGSLSDPFRVAELGRESWSQIAVEFSALAMTGGRRVVIARDATDAILPFVTAAMGGAGEALLIVEAPGLAKGKLRSYAEASKDAAALASYAPDGAALASSITTLLSEQELQAEPDAIALLSQMLAADRQVMRGEVEKLALFAAPAKTIDVDMVRACTGAGAAASADEAILAMLTGNLQAGDAAIESAFADGLNGVGLLRAALSQLQRLHLASLRVAEGESPAEAIRAIRPPVFYKTTGIMTKALAMWTSDRLEIIIDEARRAELACKQTGSLPDLLARRFLYTIAGMARR